MVNATPRGKTTSCILSVTVVNGKVSWRCADPPVTPATPAPEPPTASANHTSASGVAVAAGDSNTPSVDPLAATWEDAEPCSTVPNKTNSVQDAMGRLWGYEHERPCSYRAADGTSLYYSGYIAVRDCVGCPSTVCWKQLRCVL